MAELKCDIKVSVEKCINERLKLFFNELSKEHGICITSVSVDWNNFSSLGEKLYKVKRISIDMTSDVQ